ncbi:RNA polymerase sigma factor [Flectobacillus major]|jgi:RNA polymerase sigma factor (sigma-70 family)|uniref:RNA polymerase sigma factor n=1 Tax=Flectobacillus major TaxID=103 RepID=UPI0003FB8DFD|nr:sigma-70 family RNA polymerase sigma factor [Flectobacillus major]
MNNIKKISKEPNDDWLWQRFLAGDKQAFGELMNLHVRTLFHYGSKFSKDKEFIKDCIQDLFLILWERRNNLSKDIAVKPYLMASLRRHIHRNASQVKVMDFPREEGVDTFDVEFSVEDRFIANEMSLSQAQRISESLNLLPKRQKEVVYLKYFQGLDREQISDIMEIAPQTASNLLQMAIRQLKTYWKVEITLLLMMICG